MKLILIHTYYLHINILKYDIFVITIFTYNLENISLNLEKYF